MRLKTDENLPLSVVRLLRDGGHDVHTALEEHLGGSGDANLLGAATHESRTLVTLDKDFADIRAYPPDRFFGILVLRPRDQTTARLRTLIKRVLPLLNANDLAGKLWVIDEYRVRIR
jgi:predicted nuclease of predicted toxin-antitoxin system